MSEALSGGTDALKKTRSCVRVPVNTQQKTSCERIAGSGAAFDVIRWQIKRRLRDQSVVLLATHGTLDAVQNHSTGGSQSGDLVRGRLQRRSS